MINHKWPWRKILFSLFGSYHIIIFCVLSSVCLTNMSTVCANSNNQHYCFSGTLPREAPSHHEGDASHSKEGHVCKTGGLTKISHKPQKDPSMGHRMNPKALEIRVSLLHLEMLNMIDRSINWSIDRPIDWQTDPSFPGILIFCN